MNATTEIGDDLKITKTTRRASAGGTWVKGRLNGHRFDALVFPEHAECESFELDKSRISKLYLICLGTGEEVACFDRGWDTRPKNETAGEIVDFLAAGLAEHVYGA